MEIKSSGLFPFGEPRHGGDGEGPSNIQVLLSLVGVALALIGGYFLMKIINMSRLKIVCWPGIRIASRLSYHGRQIEGSSTELRSPEGCDHFRGLVIGKELEAPG